MKTTEKAVILGGFKQFNPSLEPEGKLFAYISGGNKLCIGKLMKDEQTWWLEDMLNGKKRFPYTSQVLLLEDLTIRDVTIKIN